MPAFDTPNPIAVHIEAAVSRVLVEATDRDDTVVEVLPSNPRRAADVTAAEQTTVDYADGRLRITGPRRWAIIGPSETIEVRLQVPAGSSLVGRLGVGNLRTVGRLGDVNVKTGAGQLVVDQAAQLRLRTGAGDIDVDHASGVVDLSTGAGTIRIDAAEDGGVIADSVGDVTIGRVSGSLEASSSSGNITTDQVSGSLSAKTAYGAVRVRSALQGSLRLESGYGEVEVAVAAGTAAWLDVTSKKGLVRSELVAEGAPAPGTPTVEVRARTNWGDITITRAADRSRD